MARGRDDWVVRHVGPRDRSTWGRLYHAYGEFYKRDLTTEHLDLVWRWLTDGSLVGLVVGVEQNGEPVGLAHLRPFVRPLDGSVGGYLDDLFVDPPSRGNGAVEALFSAMADEGRNRDWSVIRWITAEHNARARAVYDRIATATPWVTYDLAPRA